MNLGEPAWRAFYGLVFVATAILVESTPVPAGSRGPASVALVAMIPWYLIFGRSVIRLNEQDWNRYATSWRGPAYLTGLLALFVVVDHANPNSWFLAFGFSPQCFQMTTQRRAMAFVVAFNSVAALTGWLDEHTAQNASSGVAIALFAIGFSWVFSRWTARVIEQSHERAALLAQLEAAQEELAVVNREAGVLAERERLSAEIHDTLAQGFLSIVTLIQAAQGTGVAPPAGAHLDLALATARENLDEARALVADLAPASLDDGGLPGAVARAAKAIAQAAGLEVVCATEGTPRPLPTATEVVLLRVAQEALSNVRKHAGACRAIVRLGYQPAAVQLSVADDGAGFAPGETGTGFGLRGMRERLRQANGTLTVTSAPGAGTTVQAEIPA